MFKPGINDKADDIIGEPLTDYFSLLICFNQQKKV